VNADATKTVFFDPYGSLDPVDVPRAVRLRIFRHICIYIFFCMIIGVLVFASFGENRVYLKAVYLIGAVAGIFLIVLSAPGFFRIWWRRLPGLELRPEGFIDYRLSSSLIRWDEIAQWSVWGPGLVIRVVVLCIDLRPGVADRLPMSPEVRLQFNRNSSMFISAKTFECSFAELVKVFERYAPRARL
jgi:hypothetical protein